MYGTACVVMNIFHRIFDILNPFPNNGITINQIRIEYTIRISLNVGV